MEYTLIRSGRKTLALTVDGDGRLIVRAPYRISAEGIEQFIAEKAEWIEKHTATANRCAERKNKRLSSPPEALPLFGRLCPVINEKPYGYTDGAFYLPGEMTLEALVPYLHKLYGRIAEENLIPRVQTLSKQTGLAAAAVKINSAKTRWGSCSGAKSVNLSHRLAAAEPKLIDYVIIHELCHTVHMDHSPDFYRLVSGFLPDYREREKGLREVSRLLAEYGL